jgi:murein DD-endopeptidase MepM/ murein hydrolase activator NlpD
MSIHTARLRALYLCAFVALCLLAAGERASADDGTSTPPRAVPLARALPATFASYDALIDTASAVANDQTTLYAQLLIARVQVDAAHAALANVADPRVRGGLVRTETNVSDVAALAVIRARIAATSAAEAQLIAGGAIPVPPAPVWQRPLAGRVSQRFGPTRFAFEPARIYEGAFYSHFHDGVDIVAAPGTPVLAPARARVVFTGRMPDSAEVVVLAHDNGLVSLYAHLEDGPLRPTVKAGDIVQAGERIGAVGLTGLTTGYHLHWAVYKNGEPLDPLSTLGG